MHFTFNNETHQQCDGVAMGSPLGPVIPEIFKVELEKPLIPTLMEDVSLGTVYGRHYSRYKVNIS